MSRFFSEPLFILVQKKFLYRIRTISEALAIFLKCCITFITAYWCNLNNGIENYGALPFALGQLGYSIILFLSYFILLSRYLKNKVYFFPKKIVCLSDKSFYFFHRPTLMLAITMTAQSLFKYILTEGDQFLTMWYMTEFDQGMYALVVNYGSLIARLIFNPIEDLSRNIFSRLCLRKNNDNHLLARNILFIVMKLYIILSIFIVTFGPLYCSVFIEMVVGSKWNRTYASSALKLYIFYIPVMAINGITEAFVQSVSTPGDIKRQSYWIFFFSGLFIFGGCIFLGYFNLGVKGLILINIINLSTRATWCLIYIHHYFKGLIIELIFPSKMLFLYAIFIGYFMRLKVHSIATISDILIGIIMAGLLLCICIHKEKDVLKILYTQYFAVKL